MPPEAALRRFNNGDLPPPTAPNDCPANLTFPHRAGPGESASTGTEARLGAVSAANEAGNPVLAEVPSLFCPTPDTYHTTPTRPRQLLSAPPAPRSSPSNAPRLHSIAPLPLCGFSSSSSPPCAAQRHDYLFLLPSDSTCAFGGGGPKGEAPSLMGGAERVFSDLLLRSTAG